MRQGELRWGDDISLGKALGQTDAESRLLIFSVTIGGQPHVQRQHFGVYGATRQVRDRREGIKLLRVLKQHHTGKGFWLVANSELRHEKRRPGATECFRGRPLHKGVAKE